MNTRQYVRPFVNTIKTDVVDADADWEAVRWHSMGFAALTCCVSARGDMYLCTLLIHWARAIITCQHKGRASWINRLLAGSP
ncbi:hypothetical protein GL267_007010 [Acidithiobacillus ferrianus]|uniref:Uncharacterized protein n=2 Tax=Acidithiobacillus ferrianus TaxID=2678518 RepID=A0A845UHI1_9PROT|nr:hypothetical protein [Acidithiobacillus ferrianus]NDU43980.1 hypothetical protein [Acidithiobacillus ferrianus]